MPGSPVIVVVEEHGKIDNSRLRTRRRWWPIKDRRFARSIDLSNRRRQHRSLQTSEKLSRTVICRTHRRCCQGSGEPGLRCCCFQPADHGILPRGRGRHVDRLRGTSAEHEAQQQSTTAAKSVRLAEGELFDNRSDRFVVQLKSGLASRRLAARNGRPRLRLQAFMDLTAETPTLPILHLPCRPGGIGSRSRQRSETPFVAPKACYCPARPRFGRGLLF